MIAMLSTIGWFDEHDRLKMHEEIIFQKYYG